MFKVYAHARCTDGFGAAWAAHRWLRPNAGENVSYRFIAAGGRYEPTDEEVAGKDVLCLDTSFDRETHIRVANRARTFMTYDHHAYAVRHLKGLSNLTLDVTRSGAGLTWDKLSGGAKRSWLIDYVEDWDLWKFALPNSREINAYLQLQPATFGRWDELADNPQGEKNAHVEGQYYYKQIRASVLATVSRAGYITFEGARIPSVSAATYASYVGEELLRKYPKAPFVIVWTTTSSNTVALSLRSSPEGDDVDRLAERVFGGGGHPRAAGATISLARWVEFWRTSEAD